MIGSCVVCVCVCVCVCVTALGLLLHGLFSSCCEQRLASSYTSQASHSAGFSCCRAWTVGHTGFSICSSRALGHSLNSCGAWA